ERVEGGGRRRDGLVGRQPGEVPGERDLAARRGLERPRAELERARERRLGPGQHRLLAVLVAGAGGELELELDGVRGGPVGEAVERRREPRVGVAVAAEQM